MTREYSIQSSRGKNSEEKGKGEVRTDLMTAVTIELMSIGGAGIEGAAAKAAGEKKFAQAVRRRAAWERKR